MNRKHIEELILRHPKLSTISHEIEKSCEILIDAYSNGGKVLVCGNGGSCSDADHIVGELMKGFLKKRPLPTELKKRFTDLGGEALINKLQMPLRAINLCSLPSLTTAFSNDVDANFTFAQQALAYTDKGDIFIGISTSGNAKNVYYAAVAAKACGAKLIGMTGAEGGKMKESNLYDVIIHAPETVTHHIQETHIAIYHAICIVVEEYFFAI